MARRRHEPTEVTRAEVRSLAQFGVREDEISVYIGIDPKTLRKYYREELTKSHIKANFKVANAMFNAAVNHGSVPAQKFWMKARAGWTEKPPEDLELERRLKQLQIQMLELEIELRKQSPRDRGTVAELLNTLIAGMPD